MYYYISTLVRILLDNILYSLLSRQKNQSRVVAAAFVGAYMYPLCTVRLG